jgi:hypothetical protein
LKKIASWIVPDELLDIAKETMDNFKFTGTGLKIYSQIKAAVESGVIFLLGNNYVPNHVMKLFPWMNDKASVLLEEILKLIPGFGLIISIKEIIDDWRKGKITVLGAIGRIVFHNWQYLIPFWAQLLTLPLRIGWHFVWNKAVKYRKSVLETLQNMTYDKLEPPITEFTVVNHDPSYPRYPQSEPVAIPKDMNNENTIKEMLSDITEDPRNPVFIACTVASTNSAGVKNGNNLASAYLKRNIQDRPLKKLKPHFIKSMDTLVEFWKTKLDIKPVDTWDWINNKNHGPKKAMYAKAYRKFLEDSNIEYKATLNVKYDEITMKPLMRTICAFDNSYVVNVAPTIASCSEALKKIFDGYTNLSNSDKYTLHVLYVTGMTSDEISNVIDDNKIESTIPHFLLLVLGDDSALIRETKVLCCDFSRYDSTQHPEQHEAFRKLFTTSFNQEQMDMLRKAASAPTQMFIPSSMGKVHVDTRGLKTGCVETSVSNTTITALSYAMALNVAMDDELDPFEYIPKYLQGACGFLPKASYQDHSTGFEFLKTIFIQQNERTISLPLLSSMAKLGKFLKKPSLIVPLAKLKNDKQIAVDAIMMQLKGKGNLQNVPGFKRWYKKIARLAQPFLPALHDEFRHQLKLSGRRVLIETISTAYESRYSLEWKTIDSFFEELALLDRTDYPVTYTSTVIQRAIEVDYGLDPPI